MSKCFLVCSWTSDSLHDRSLCSNILVWIRSDATTLVCFGTHHSVVSEHTNWFSLGRDEEILMREAQKTHSHTKHALSATTLKAFRPQAKIRD